MCEIKFTNKTLAVLIFSKNVRFKSMNFQVKESRKPSFANETSDDENRIVNFTDEVEIWCKVDGFPAPQITWTKNGEPLVLEAESKKYGWYFDAQGKRIQNNRVIDSDSGVYKCRAENVAGYVEKRTELKVCIMNHFIPR